jgi:hypothetical protein
LSLQHRIILFQQMLGNNRSPGNILVSGMQVLKVASDFVQKLSPHKDEYSFAADPLVSCLSQHRRPERQQWD